MYPAPTLTLRTFEALTFWKVHYYLKLLSILKNDRILWSFQKKFRETNSTLNIAINATFQNSSKWMPDSYFCPRNLRIEIIQHASFITYLILQCITGVSHAPRIDLQIKGMLRLEKTKNIFRDIISRIKNTEVMSSEQFARHSNDLRI